MSRSLIKLSGLVKPVTKIVTGYLRMSNYKGFPILDSTHPLSCPLHILPPPASLPLDVLTKNISFCSTFVEDLRWFWEMPLRWFVHPMNTLNSSQQFLSVMELWDSSCLWTLTSFHTSPIWSKKELFVIFFIFFSIRPPSELLPVCNKAYKFGHVTCNSIDISKIC